MVRKAFNLAESERPGATYLAVPEDVEAMATPAGARSLPRNVPRPDEPSAPQIARAAAVLEAAQRPIVLAGHGAARAGAADALLRFATRLGLPVATTFHAKGVFPDDHPQALVAVGFMRQDHVNFGFDRADVIVSVGYELQELDPTRLNPEADKRIVHLSRLPAEVDSHYNVDVGIQGDLSWSLDALAEATSRRFHQDWATTWPSTSTTPTSSPTPRASVPGATGWKRRSTCCRCCKRRWPPTPSRSSPARSTTARTCA